MPNETLCKSFTFINQITKEKNIPKPQITFHGGEPLLAGKEFFKEAIPKIKETISCEAYLSIQSNLWLLDDELCELFKKYHVGIGSSLDGPERINDRQRSSGYYKKTFGGIELLKKHGMSCGCIATFTKQSAEKPEEIFNFFIEKGLHFDVHAAIKPIALVKDDIFLSPKEFGELLIQMLEMYLKNLTKLKIGTLDTLIKNVANKKSGLCTFSKCLGEYFAITPDGGLYTCYRFVGRSEFCLGNIKDIQSFSDITKSAVWQKQKAWQDWIDKECGECLYKEFCHGGCPYAAFASGNGSFKKDPMCGAYKMIYSYIIDKGAEEFFSEEHMANLSQPENDKQIQFSNNPLLYIMHDNPHPYDVQQTAKKIIVAALLGKTGNPKQTTEKLLVSGIINSFEEKYPVVERFYEELTQPVKGFNNLYIHLTNLCNLSCSHCYSYDGNRIFGISLNPEIIMQLVEEASKLKFIKVIFTGGEPFQYSDFERLLNELLPMKNNKKLPKLVLRTNLSNPLNARLVGKLNRIFDQIVVSLDGSEEIHDRQRGKGAYRKTMDTLALFDKKILEEKVSFACVLNLESLSDCDFECEREKVIAIKERFKVKEIRFLPVLPLGRAKQLKTSRIGVEKIGVIEWIKRKYYFRTSCGLGQSVMIEPNGDVYPCHVLKETEKIPLGNVYHNNLLEITQNETFIKLRNITVNTNDKCNHCDMRYLCGGVCKIWNNQDCSDLYMKAECLLKDALMICKIKDTNWLIS